VLQPKFRRQCRLQVVHVPSGRLVLDVDLWELPLLASLSEHVKAVLP
jgi:hypothetical protein